MATWNSRGLRGSTLEDLVNRTNEQYAEKKLALIQKIPTPITPVRMDKENRHITLAYFEQRSTVDYIGAVQGIPVCFDAKECCVFINGEEDEEANSHVPETPTGNYGPYVVPEGCYFMLGDNREHSKDSRFWSNTFVTYDEIVGKAIVRYYPSIKVLE